MNRMWSDRLLSKMTFFLNQRQPIGPGQSKAKCAAMALITPGFDYAPVPLDNHLADEQTKSGAAFFCGIFAFHLGEPFENAFFHTLRYTTTFIDNVHLHKTSRGLIRPD